MLEEVYWSDRKRICGLPISFTKYALTPTRLRIKAGLLQQTHDEIELYRINDFQVTRNIFDLIFRVGSIHLRTSDQHNREFVVQKVAQPLEVKELLSTAKDIARKEKGVHVNEFIGGEGYTGL